MATVVAAAGSGLPFTDMFVEFAIDSTLCPWENVSDAALFYKTTMLLEVEDEISEGGYSPSDQYSTASGG